MFRVHANLHRLARWVRTDYLDIYQQCTSSPAFAFRWRILRHCQATRSTNLLPAGVMFSLPGATTYGIQLTVNTSLAFPRLYLPTYRACYPSKCGPLLLQQLHIRKLEETALNEASKSIAEV
jgi:hypothetical protein